MEHAEQRSEMNDTTDTPPAVNIDKQPKRTEKMYILIHPPTTRRNPYRETKQHSHQYKPAHRKHIHDVPGRPEIERPSGRQSVSSPTGQYPLRHGVRDIDKKRGHIDEGVKGRAACDVEQAEDNKEGCREERCADGHVVRW